MKKILLRLLLLLLAAPLQAIPAPDFTITTTDGIQRHLYADYLNQGKVVVIEIFFTTCPPCNTHAPHWQTLYQNMLAAHPGQVEFFILSNLASDNNTKVAQYRTNKGLTMPGAGSNGGSLTAVQPYQADQFGPFLGTPTFIVLAPGSGEVFFDIRGSSPANTMTLLSQKIAQVVPSECVLESYDDLPVSPVQLHIQATSGFDTTFTALGGYALNAIPALQNTSYTVTPRKTDNALEGVTTYDMVLISRHLLALEPFQYPWQSIAADVNASGSVTAFDIVQIRKVILGIFDTFPAGVSWRFEPASITGANGGCQDFKGIKLGDLNGPTAAVNRTGAAWPLWLEPGFCPPGQTCRLVWRAGTSLELSALQLSLTIDPQVVEVLGLESNLPGFDEDCYNLAATDRGELPVSWYGQHPVALSPNEEVLTIIVKSRRTGRTEELIQISDQGLPALAWDAAGAARTVEMGLSDPKVELLKGTSPVISNPIPGGFTIEMNHNRDETLPLQLFDARGILIWEDRIEVRAGENRLEVHPEVPEAGTYFLALAGRGIGSIGLFGEH